MQLRHVGVLLLLLVIGIFAVANWTTIAEPTTLNLLIGQVQAPIGLMMLIALGALTAIYTVMLMVVERRLMRDGLRAQRALEDERKRVHDREASEVHQLKETVTKDLSEIKTVLGRLVNNITDLRVYAAGNAAGTGSDSTPAEGSTPAPPSELR